MWAKVTLPPANGVSQLSHHAVDHALPQTPPLLQVPYGATGAGLRPADSVSTEGRRLAEEAWYLQRKDQGRPIPLARRLFSVDNLSWSLCSRELCSRALGQDPSSLPPLGHVGGAGAGCGPGALSHSRGFLAALQFPTDPWFGATRLPQSRGKADCSTPCWLWAGPAHPLPANLDIAF